MNIVVLGLSLSSSWGNGHATTYRSLVRGLAEEGHGVLFLERDVPWYASQRDLPDPDFCRLSFYRDLGELDRYRCELAAADAVIVGSYTPEGIALIDRLDRLELRRLLFYDIDTPVTLARLRRGEEEYLARRQIPLFDLYLSFSGGRVLAALSEAFEARRAVALYCSVDAASYAPTGAAPRWDLGYLGTYSPDRQPGLTRLLLEPARALPDLHFVVAGPQYPDGIDWPENVERIEHLSPSAHAAFYGRQRFTLNVTRSDMAAAGWSPSVRLFEAAACGVPIISDRWEGLDELLPAGDAILPVETADDVIALLRGLGEPERRRIGSAARERILASHTGRVRAAELAALIEATPPRRRRTNHVPGPMNVLAVS